MSHLVAVLSCSFVCKEGLYDMTRNTNDSRSQANDLRGQRQATGVLQGEGLA